MHASTVPFLYIYICPHSRPPLVRRVKFLLNYKHLLRRAIKEKIQVNVRVQCMLAVLGKS